MKNYENENYGECSRCGLVTLEHLHTYCHCANCFYSPDLDEPVNPACLSAAMIALEIEERAKQVSPAKTPTEFLEMASGW